jgi:broad specificity phosphatase PhoE
MPLRVFLLSHAATAAMRRGAFPGNDPLDARAIEAVAAWGQRGRLPAPEDALVLRSPALCAGDTAQALGITAAVVPALADVDYGRWRGLDLGDIAASEPAMLAAWLTDVEAAPHGGESFDAVVLRVGAWLAGLDDRAPGGNETILAITHAAIVRAAIVHALGAPSSAFARIEVGPLALVELRRSPRGWLLVYE